MLDGSNRLIERRLCAHGLDDGIDVVFLTDLHKTLYGERKQVDMVGSDRIGHDGRRIGIDENDLNAFFTKGAGGLTAGVIEFAGLADDDGSGADDQHGTNRGIFRHAGRLLQTACKGSERAADED